MVARNRFSENSSLSSGGTSMGAFPAHQGGSSRYAASRNKLADDDGKAEQTLVVGLGISVQGTVQDAEKLIVEGTVESSMIKARELVVMPKGLFKGSIDVESAEIYGTIDGTLQVQDDLTVGNSGCLLGKASCRRLRVEEGGRVTGQLEMITGDSSSSTTSTVSDDDHTSYLDDDDDILSDKDES